MRIDELGMLQYAVGVALLEHSPLLCYVLDSSVLLLSITSVGLDKQCYFNSSAVVQQREHDPHNDLCMFLDCGKSPPPSGSSVGCLSTQ